MPRNGCSDSNNTNNSTTNASGACGGGGGGGGNSTTSSAAAASAGSDGCIYPDEVIMEKGVAFSVRYTGCVEVKTSMKSLDFATRTQVARECINRVCEAAGLKSAGKRRVDKKILQYISDRPCMQNAGTNVIINVSSRALNLINAETLEVIVSHSMPRISFASGGDSDTLDFLAYIAKNEEEWRACYVLECIGGQSEDLIITIGKAFMLRFNAMNGKAHQPAENYNTGKENDKDYYNDLPDKLPPDLLTENDIPPELQQQLLQQHHQYKQQQQQQQQQQQKQFQHQQQQQLPHQTQQQKVSQLNLKKPRDRLSSNLIDLNSPPPDQTTNKMNLSNFDPIRDAAVTAAGVNSNTCAMSGGSSAAGGAGSGTGAVGGALPAGTVSATPMRDVFDIQPFSLSAEVQRSQLLPEAWFHAAISRPIAEGLLKNDGDFLVRESQGKLGQYVLTGLEGKTPKHLLLIDPEGVVRTKDRIFDNISHLIHYHWANALPIISEDTELVLRNPVYRTTTPAAITQQHQQQQQLHTHSQHVQEQAGATAIPQQHTALNS